MSNSNVPPHIQMAPRTASVAGAPISHLRAASRTIVFAYFLLLSATTFSDGGLVRLAIYSLPALIVMMTLLSQVGASRFDARACEAVALLLGAFFLSAIINGYLTYSSRQYFFAILAPLSLVVTTRIDRRFLRDLALCLVAIQAAFLLVRIAEGTLVFKFDVFNTDAVGRARSESFIGFPLSALALYFAMTKQYRWLIASIVTVFLGLRRGPVLALAVGLIAYYLTTFVRLSKAQTLILLCAIFAVGVIGSMYATSLLAAGELLLGDSVSLSQFTNGRSDMYIMLQRPLFASLHGVLFGNGPGFNVDFLAGAFAGAAWDHPHNDYFAILLDYGVVGYALITGSWLILIGTTRYSIAIASYMAALWFVDNTFVYYFHTIVLLFVVWGLRHETAKLLSAPRCLVRVRDVAPALRIDEQRFVSGGMTSPEAGAHRSTPVD